MMSTAPATCGHGLCNLRFTGRLRLLDRTELGHGIDRVDIRNLAACCR